MEANVEVKSMVFFVCVLSLRNPVCMSHLWASQFSLLPSAEEPPLPSGSAPDEAEEMNLG